MIPVLVASNIPYAGRTFVSLGLAMKLQEMSFSVGYMKPFGTVPVRSGKDIYDADALFAREVLSLKEPIESISPFTMDVDQQNRLLSGDLKDGQKKVLSAFRSLQKKDFVIIGGANDLFEGSLAGLDAVSLAGTMKAFVLFVEPWRGDSSVDEIFGCAKFLGKHFFGAVLNKVPEAALAHVKQEVRPFLEKQGILLFGTFPKDRFLESVTVRQLNEILNGNVLCCEDRLDGNVENFLIGAMDVDSALTYFRRTPNKAVITGAHRSDIQLAALETSTKCIIVTGGFQSNEVVLGKARASGTPILSVPDDTFTAIDKIETRMGKSSIRERRKADRAKQIFEREFDLYGFLNRFKKA